ncbi:MAG: S1 RNA-binding domain-containing protein [Chloroflexi bacterium]|nr:S1 RNA-binding domain-containing protein [Chloroflexota bacterium]
MHPEQPWEEKPAEAYWNAVIGDAKPPAAPPGESGWTRAESSYAGGQVLELAVTGYNRGGLLVDMGDARGFVPASQISNFPRTLTDDARQQEMARYVGQSLRLKVIELDRARNRLILSERIANPPVSRADQILATLEAGQTHAGTVRNITDFGAFVDLGGVEGLIHVSEMAWQHVKHPRDIVTAGQAVDVYIVDVNREQRRVACSLKRMVPNPWTVVAERLHLGDWVEGAITSITDFGAFVRLADGVEGLIHISELARGDFLHPREVVQEGQAVRVRVMSIDPERQRIGLTLLRDQTDAADSADLPMPPPPDAGYWDSLAQTEE